MIVQYCSDLHLEFKANQLWLAENPIEPAGDILILAGDTFYLGKEFSALPIWKSLSKNFQEVYILPGNHEYYGGYDIASNLQPLRESIRDNVWLVNNTVIEKPDIRLIFSTLWSKIGKHVTPILSGMNDFRLIHFQDKIISIDQYNMLHDTARNFLEDHLYGSCSKNQVVISHHLPSEQCVAGEFQGSLLNEAFCTDMTAFIEQSQADFWIYGHSHRNLPSFRIGNTQMLTNQLGYVSHGEYLLFSRHATFEV